MNQLFLARGLTPMPTSSLLYASDDAELPRIEAMQRAVAAGRDTSTATWAELLFWRLWRGAPVSPADARRYLALLDAHAMDLGYVAYGCLTAARLGEPDARIRLRRADSLADQLAAPDQVGSNLLVLAHCHEALGDRAGALAMLSRRALDPVYGPMYLAGSLYDEGRLALLAGDGARALRAWRHFLVLRDNPDPALRPQVAMVRRVVDSLARN